jgi:hypothetical protein
MDLKSLLLSQLGSFWNFANWVDAPWAGIGSFRMLEVYARGRCMTGADTLVEGAGAPSER